ncbi:MAG: hypothetical protein V1808_02965 [Candidatus Daviesbacteria bacterium]
MERLNKTFRSVYAKLTCPETHVIEEPLFAKPDSATERAYRRLLTHRYIYEGVITTLGGSVIATRNFQAASQDLKQISREWGMECPLDNSDEAALREIAMSQARTHDLLHESFRAEVLARIYPDRREIVEKAALLSAKQSLEGKLADPEVGANYRLGAQLMLGIVETRLRNFDKEQKAFDAH